MSREEAPSTGTHIQSRYSLACGIKEWDHGMEGSVPYVCQGQKVLLNYLNLQEIRRWHLQQRLRRAGRDLEMLAHLEACIWRPVGTMVL